MAPDLSARFTARPVEFGALKNLLVTRERTQPVAITTALYGAGDFGKTTLAAALCHDEDLVANFDDGILRVTAPAPGESRAIRRKVAGIIARSFVRVSLHLHQTWPKPP
jgi:hypothetical protein